MTQRRATTERLRRVIAGCAFVALLGFSSPAVPCGAFVAAHTATVPSLAVEQTLVLFDEHKRLEHFVRQVVIRDPAPGFGFVVPTPERPAVASVGTNPFPKLSRAFPVRSSEGRVALRGGAAGGSAGATAPLTVLSKERVGSFTAFVLAASDSSALEKWLTENRFAVVAETRAWLDHYVELGFYFAALRYERPKLAPPSGVTLAETLRISFETPLPFYPYREPRSASNRFPRELAVWLVAADAYVPVSLWHGAGNRQEWKRPWLEHSQQAVTLDDLRDLLGEPLSELLPSPPDPPRGGPRTLSVQVFEDQKRSRAGFGDVVLVPRVPKAGPPAATKLMKSLDPNWGAP